MKTIFNQLFLLFMLGGGLIYTSVGFAADVSSPISITGRISDSATKKPIGMVSIILHSAVNPAMVAGTLTDNDGFFSLSMLVPGKYYLEILSGGYEKKRIDAVEINKNTFRNNLGEISLSATVRKNLKKSLIKIISRNQENNTADTEY